MTYATVTDLIDRYGEQELIQLTDRNGAGPYDATVVARALADADSEIDGYLAARYTLPLATTPAAITRVACDLARYRLFGDHMTEVVRTRYEDAVRLLQGVAKGSVTLGLPATTQPAVESGAEIQSGGRIFDRADNGFI